MTIIWYYEDIFVVKISPIRHFEPHLSFSSFKRYSQRQESAAKALLIATYQNLKVISESGGGLRRDNFPRKITPVPSCLMLNEVISQKMAREGVFSFAPSREPDRLFQPLWTQFRRLFPLSSEAFHIST